MALHASRRGEFRNAFPSGTFLDPETPKAIEDYARSRGLIGADDRLVSLTRAGDGNMNLTLRLVTERGSLILKQARPWVEKYPDIPAPPGRSEVELAFYEAVSSRPALARRTPRLLGSDPASGVLALEDLGEAQDFTPLYRGAVLGEEELDDLVDFLAVLHTTAEPASDEARGVFANRAMRALDHEHIFRLPLAEDNGIDLDSLSEGLAAAARPLQRDRDYVEAVTELGKRYLDDGDVLVHGDYFPGSWLAVADGIRVIDPEFCFLGEPAFDVGFMLGHLHLARQPEALCQRLLARYAEATGSSGETSRLARRFAGVEIMRRLIGVAQLPIHYPVEQRRELLETSRELVLS